MKILNLTLVGFIGGIMTWTQPQICAANVPAGTTILVRTTKKPAVRDVRVELVGFVWSEVMLALFGRCL